MSVQFTLPSKTRIDSFKDRASINDAITYIFDCAAWQEDNSTITSATWVVESGTASISGQTLSSGIVSALVTFSQAGKALISILLNTATQKKKMWLEVGVRDMKIAADDYGIST